MARTTAQRAGIGCVTVLLVGMAASIAVPLLTRRSDWDWRSVPIKESKALASVSVRGKDFVLRRLLESEWDEGGDAKGDNDTFDNVSLDNRATWLYVDQDEDGNLEPLEGRPSNLPIRIRDSMFDVRQRGDEHINPVPSKAALQGIVLNRICPPFAYTDLEGKKLSRESLAGKVTVIHVWSASCETSVLKLADMARWRRKYGDRIHLISLSVDRSYADTDAAIVSVRKALKREGVTWPVVLEPQGWNGLARRFNLYHFGFFVLSADSVVRDANLSSLDVDHFLQVQYP